ncbi:MAG: hypothetical protein PHP85_14675 [Gallionella sp.]|nr:hypothetical protein [Gallionella sp.]
MIVTCPACNSSNSLDSLVGHEQAREALLLAFNFPVPLAAPFIKYLGLFRSGKRALSFDKVASLLGEVLPIIQSATITRNRQTYSAPIEYWVLGLEKIHTVRDLALPLKTNGLLLTIICDLTERAASKAENAQEQHRAGRTTVATVAAHQPAKLPTRPTEPRQGIPDCVKAALKPNTS